MVSNATLLQYLNSEETLRLREALLSNIREEAAKENKSKNQLSIIKKMFTGVKDKENVYNLQQVGSDGKYYYIDGFRCYRSVKNFGFTDNPNPLKGLEKYFEYSKDFTTEINIDDLKTFCKAHPKRSKEKRVTYIIKLDDDLFEGFNPHYLLEAIQFTNSSVLNIEKKTSSTTDFENLGVMYCSNLDGTSECVLLPIHLTKGRVDEFIANGYKNV